uniref:thiamine pyrophosphate-binding protein n=1 Tax=Nocardioides sp. TaxID=35761 RepID=UPI0025DE42B9
MKFHEVVGRALVEQGLTTAFGVIGDANLFMMDSFERVAGGTYVAMANEAGAVMAATGYASVTGTPGLATVTHGPGLTNTVTALVEAARSRTPLLLVAGDTPVADGEHLQDVAQREVVLATGAAFVRVRDPQ